MRWILFICCVLLMTGCNEKKIMSTENQIDQGFSEETNNQTEEKQIEQNFLNKVNDQTEGKEKNQEFVSNPSNENIETIPVIKEEQMITHAESVEQEVMTLLSQEKSETIKEKIADKFITLVDFIYYDAPINGIYFKDLTESAQTKIKAIANRIDGAIESKFPNYKSTLKQKYQTVLAYVKDKANVVSDKVQEKVENTIGSENYQNFVDAKEDMKDSFQNAAEIISDGASQIYQSGKDKVSNWYQGLKEKYDK